MVLWSLEMWEGAQSILRRVTILAAVLAMLLVATAALAQTMPELGDENELRCFLPEGCDINGDDIPELRAGEPVEGNSVGSVQYASNTTH